MATLLIELTNRCNLNCRHCFDQRHGGHDDIRLPVIEKIIGRAGEHDFDTIVFTGGEPTLHRQFPQIVRRVYEAGYRFGFVSNGQNFQKIYPQIKFFLDRLETITFSLDGVTPESHDSLRGDGTFTNLLKAISICVAKEIPFTFNSVLTAHNIHEIELLAGLAQQLGSGGVRFGQLMLTPAAMDHGLALTPDMINTVADKIEKLKESHTYPIGMGPGFYTALLFPCASLQMAELTITHSGHLALCCHLPDHGSALLHQDSQLDLNHVEFEEAFATWQGAVQSYRSTKKIYFNNRGKGFAEHLPCWFCQSYSNQVNWLKAYANTHWFRFIEENNFLGRPSND
ncbi:MAG: radical SAM protein [Desulfosarcina sp.]|nr:radical SAM protein [Desulfosarcina sp.]